jgi:hypothetical protein
MRVRYDKIQRLRQSFNGFDHCPIAQQHKLLRRTMQATRIRVQLTTWLAQHLYLAAATSMRTQRISLHLDASCAINSELGRSILVPLAVQCRSLPHPSWLDMHATLVPRHWANSTGLTICIFQADIHAG